MGNFRQLILRWQIPCFNSQLRLGPTIIITVPDSANLRIMTLEGYVGNNLGSPY